jgi:hypothetical protein
MSSINGNLFVAGILQPTNFSPPALCIPDAAVSMPAGGASGIQTAKMNHRQHVRHNQAEGVAVVTETRQVWITNGTAGVVNSFKAQLKVANIGAATITIDLKKNGTSILSAPISFSSADAALAIKTATIVTSATANNDYFEYVTTATVGGGTLGQGLYLDALIDEYPS